MALNLLFILNLFIKLCDWSRNSTSHFKHEMKYHIQLRLFRKLLTEISDSF